jgi:hypothetical protein
VLRDENARFQYLQLIYSRIKMKPGKALAILLVLGIGAAILPQLCGQTQTGGTLPSAKEIVAKYDEALGGEAALRRHTSSTMKGTNEVHGQSSDAAVRLLCERALPALGKGLIA